MTLTHPIPPIHPVAQLLPLLGDAELASLSEDIRQNGQREPCVMYRGQLLDGRNRWLACDRAGTKATTREFGTRPGDGTDPISFVVSTNLHRRHLDESQRAMVAARTRALFEAEARERMAMGGKAAAGDRTASANLQTAPPVRTAERAASLVNVSPRSVAHGSVVLASKIPGLAEAVDRGVVAVSAAAEAAKSPAVDKVKEALASGDEKKIRQAVKEAAKEIRKEDAKPRRSNDAYMSAGGFVRPLLPFLGKGARIIEPCAGACDLVEPLRAAGHEVFTADIDTACKVDRHADATQAATWAAFPEADWAVSNLPFSVALEILQHAYEHAKVGVAFILRLTFLEPTTDDKRSPPRAPWLVEHPLTSQIVLPRYSFTGDGNVDSVTCSWMIWVKGARPAIFIPRPDDNGMPGDLPGLPPHLREEEADGGACPFAVVIGTLADGELSPAARAFTQEHLTHCAPCRGTFEDVLQLGALATSAQAAASPPPPTKLRITAWEWRAEAHVEDRAWECYADAQVNYPLAASVCLSFPETRAKGKWAWTVYTSFSTVMNEDDTITGYAPSGKEGRRLAAIELAKLGYEVPPDTITESEDAKREDSGYAKPREDEPAVGPIVCRQPSPAEQEQMAKEFPEYVKPWPKAPGFKEAASPDGERCTSICAEPGLAMGERCMLKPEHAPHSHISGGVEWTLDEALVERIAAAWHSKVAGEPAKADANSRQAVIAVLTNDAEGMATWTDEAHAEIRACAERCGYKPAADRSPPAAIGSNPNDAIPASAADIKANRSPSPRTAVKPNAAKPAKKSGKRDAKPAKAPPPVTPPVTPPIVDINDPKLIKAIEKAYSADSIAEKGTIRQPVFLGGSFWTNVGGSDKGPGPRAQLWRLEPIDTYKGLTYTRQEQEDERRLHKREPGDCTGLVVKWKRDEYVLCDPRAYRWGAPEGL